MSFRHFCILLISLFLLTACAQVKTVMPQQQPTNPPLVGGDRDAHGCIGSAGYMWCEPKQKCLRIWEENCEVAVGQPCIADKQCVTPGEYLVQSNCPFSSACIDEKCKVVCPINYNDPNAKCQADSDCNCTERGEKSLKCLCHAGKCLSVE